MRERVTIPYFSHGLVQLQPKSFCRSSAQGSLGGGVRCCVLAHGFSVVGDVALERTLITACILQDRHQTAVVHPRVGLDGRVHLLLLCDSHIAYAVSYRVRRYRFVAAQHVHTFTGHMSWVGPFIATKYTASRVFLAFFLFLRPKLKMLDRPNVFARCTAPPL